MSSFCLSPIKLEKRRKSHKKATHNTNTLEKSRNSQIPEAGRRWGGGGVFKTTWSPCLIKLSGTSKSTIQHSKSSQQRIRESKRKNHRVIRLTSKDFSVTRQVPEGVGHGEWCQNRWQYHLGKRYHWHCNRYLYSPPQAASRLLLRLIVWKNQGVQPLPVAIAKFFFGHPTLVSLPSVAFGCGPT